MGLAGIAIPLVSPKRSVQTQVDPDGFKIRVHSAPRFTAVSVKLGPRLGVIDYRLANDEVSSSAV
jgi:hypothetical protein